MKRIEKYNNLVEELKNLKLKRKLYDIFVCGGSIIALGVMFLLLIVDITVDPNRHTTNICMINLFMQLFLHRERNFRKQEKEYYYELESYLNDFDYVSVLGLSSSSIEIVPKNIKIGEDLSSRNIVPIFKEGKYAIIKSDFIPVFIREYESDSETFTEIMEYKDINTLLEELPEYKSEIGKMKILSKYDTYEDIV